MPRPKRPAPVRTVLPSLRVAQAQESLHLSRHPVHGSDQSHTKLSKDRSKWQTAPTPSQNSATSSNSATQPLFERALDGESVGRAHTRSGSSVAGNGRAPLNNTLGKRKRMDKVDAAITEASSPPPDVASQYRLHKVASPMRNASRRPSQISKLSSTPLAQSSMLGALQFKKRPRQPSLLQVAQSQQDVASDTDDFDLNAFQPDDESTPLIKSSSQSRQHPSSQSSRSSKRKSIHPRVQVVVPQSRQEHLSISSDHSSQSSSSFDLPPDDGDELPEPTLPCLPRTKTPPSLGSEMLPPLQSSSSPMKATLQTPALSRKPPPSAKPLTTARLQNLLPRRRARLKQQNTYDIPSSSDIELDATTLGEDEDELSFHATSKMRRKKATPISKPKRAQIKGDRMVAKKASKGKEASRTYSRKSVAEPHSENEDARDDTEDTSIEVDNETGKVMPVLDVKAKAEMKRLADKFKEIDDYTMEFEDMTGSSSQLRDAR